MHILLLQLQAPIHKQLLSLAGEVPRMLRGGGCVILISRSWGVVAGAELQEKGLGTHALGITGLSVRCVASQFR